MDKDNAEPYITLQDGTIVKSGDTVMVLNRLRRWTLATVKEILKGGGVDKAILGEPFGIKTRYQMKARRPRIRKLIGVEDER